LTKTCTYDIRIRINILIYGDAIRERVIGNLRIDSG